MDDPPRIVHVIPRVVRRGAEVFAAQLAEALQPVSRNLLFPLFGPAEGSPAAPVEVVSGARPAGRLEARTGIDPGAAARLRAGIRRLKPDLVVAHGGEPLKYACVADLRGRVPLAYRKISHSAGSRGERAMRALLRRPRAILAVSEGLERELVERFGVEEARVTVIPTSRKPPPELTAEERAAIRSSIGVGPDEPLIAWVGRLSEEKQPEAALKAFALIRIRFGPSALALCGDGPLRPAVDRAARAAGPGVHILGSRDDADRFIAAADLLLSTSRIEGAPGTLVEAGLAGVPAVAFDVGDVGQIVGDGETGLLVPAGDLEALADAASSLLGDLDRRARYGAAAALACAPFRLEAIAPRYAKAFADAIGPGGAGLRALG